VLRVREDGSVGALIPGLRFLAWVVGVDAHLKYW
jgi:hypothetical protein